MSQQPLLHYSLGGGPSLPGLQVWRHRFQARSKNGQFIWKAVGLGYFMDERLLSNWGTIEPLLCWENGQRREGKSQETPSRMRMFSAVSRAQEAETTWAEQDLSLATSLTSEPGLFLLTMTMWCALPVTSATVHACVGVGDSWSPLIHLA